MVECFANSVSAQMATDIYCKDGKVAYHNGRYFVKKNLNIPLQQAYWQHLDYSISSTAVLYLPNFDSGYHCHTTDKSKRHRHHKSSS